MTTETQPPYFLSLRGLSIGGRPETVTASAATAQNDPAPVYYFNSASAQTFTIPAGLTNLPVGGTITLVFLGAGAVTVAAGTGVTLNTALASLVSAGQYAVAQIMKVDSDTWLALGGLGG